MSRRELSAFERALLHPDDDEKHDEKTRGIIQIFRCASVGRELDAMTDKEIAEIMLRVWEHESMLSPISDLISSIIDRLERANGGPLPKETEP